MEDPEVKWKATTQVKRNHKDGLIKACVTTAKEMQVFAQYTDAENRLYRARWDLTEEEMGRSTDKDVSESRIWFDVYLKPLSKYQKEQGNEKALKLEMGDRVTLHVRQDRAKDTKTVKEFEGQVSDVYWGNLHKSDAETGEIYSSHNPNMGLIKVDVFGSYERSLIIDTDYNIKKYRRTLPA